MAFRCNDGTSSMQSGFCGASEFSFDLENDYRRSPRKQNVQQLREDRSVQKQQPPTPVKENQSKDEWTNADPLEASENEVPQADDTFMVVVNEEEFQNDGKDEELGEHIKEKEEEHAYNYSDMKLGSICCWCVPMPLSSFEDCMHRTLYWFKLNKDQLLAGLAVAIGQVPQVTSYAVLAGVSPSVAIQATWIMNVVTSIFGGRPGMVSGATALSVIPLIDLIQTDGISYMFYAIMFAGMLQMAFGALKLGRVLRFLPHSALVGYMNAMAVIIIFSQLKYFKLPHNGINAEAGDGRLYQYQFNFIKVLYDSTPWVSRSTIIAMSVEAALALVICFTFPRISKAIPSTALAFFILTALEWSVARYTGFPSVLVGDYVSLSGPSFPIPILMDSKYNLPPINYDTWKKVWPCGLSLFTNAIIDSLLTYRVCSERVKTRGSSSRMAFGQGLAQFASAFLGGMGGAGSLDQTIINFKSGGQTVLSTFVAGLILFVIAAGAYPAVNIVPLSAIVGVMFYSVRLTCIEIELSMLRIAYLFAIMIF
jgi:MFS superfamily sulfate permease-like transporter